MATAGHACHYASSAGARSVCSSTAAEAQPRMLPPTRFRDAGPGAVPAKLHCSTNALSKACSTVSFRCRPRRRHNPGQSLWAAMEIPRESPHLIEPKPATSLTTSPRSRPCTAVGRLSGPSTTLVSQAVGHQPRRSHRCRSKGQRMAACRGGQEPIRTRLHRPAPGPATPRSPQRARRVTATHTCARHLERHRLKHQAMPPRLPRV